MSYRLFFVTLFGTFILVGSAVAQSNDEAVDNILVTASRSPLAMPDIGSSVTVITREQIEARQSRFVTDLLRSVPGFAVSQVRSRQRRRISLGAVEHRECRTHRDCARAAKLALGQ